MKKYSKILVLTSLLVLGSCGNSPVISDSLDSIPSTSIPSTSTPGASTSTPGTSSTNEFNGYYKTIDLNAEGTALANALKTLVTSMTAGNYSGAWTAAKNADQDPNNSSNIIQIYSRYTRPKSEQNTGGSNNTWNREHVVPQSKMGCNTSTIGPCTDYHNLWASDAKVNQDRGNNPFGIVSGTNYVKDSQGRTTPAKLSGGVFDPGSEARGEVARATFYMIVRYNFSTNVNGNLETLLQWNRDYPPQANREGKRNDVVQGMQKNRNPFIDYPQLADQIWA